jgi:FkbM family methyltransferase
MKEILLKIGERILPEVAFSRFRYRVTKDRNQYYDDLTSCIIRQTVKPHSVCVDVGCHIGTILDIMMASAPQGTFYAFEPIPLLYEKLIERYGDDNRVRLSPLALSDSVGQRTFHWVTSNPGFSGFRKRHYDRSNEEITLIDVRTALLDAVVDPGHHIDLIKIDVEGAELEVLSGARKILANDQPVVVFEHGLGAADYYETTPEDIFDLLNTKCGLRISLLDGYLRNKDALTREEFHKRFYVDYDYYFVAHP